MPSKVTLRKRLSFSTLEKTEEISPNEEVQSPTLSKPKKSFLDHDLGLPSIVKQKTNDI